MTDYETIKMLISERRKLKRQLENLSNKGIAKKLEVTVEEVAEIARGMGV